MSKSIFAMVQGNVEKEIQANENKIKSEFLEFLNKKLEKMLEEKKRWYSSQMRFELEKNQSHFEWQKIAEEMGFEADYEHDSFYGDSIMLTPPKTAESEAAKLLSQHNRNVEKALKEEGRDRKAIEIASHRAADKVAKELLGKLRSGDYEVKDYNDSSTKIVVTYEAISFEGLDLEYFKFFVSEVLKKYKFKNVFFGGTLDNYFAIFVNRPGADETAE